MSGFAKKDVCYMRTKWGARPRAQYSCGSS